VQTVSDEIAENLDYSMPVDVTAFRVDRNDDTSKAGVTLDDGHHRYATALETGRGYRTVNFPGWNATEVKINNLIQLPQATEAKYGPA
jgi:hypothetical protein